MSEAPKRDQKGGVLYQDGRPVGYTKDGAEPAIEGGPVDSTVQPDFLVNDLEAAQAGPPPAAQRTPAEGNEADPGEPGVTREDAAPLTGEDTAKPTTPRTATTRRRTSMSS